MAISQSRRHLIDETKGAGVSVDAHGNIKATNSACNTKAPSDFIEPLHDFLLRAYNGTPVCKNCFKKARPQAEDPTNRSHTDLEIIMELPGAVPDEIQDLFLTDIWNLANDRFVGLPDRADPEVPPISSGTGICAVCGGRMYPGEAVEHGSDIRSPVQCSSTDRGAVHVDCLRRPIPYSRNYEEMEIL